MGLRLLKKGQKGLVHAIFSRFVELLLLLLLQVFNLFALFFGFEQFLPEYTGMTTLFSIVMLWAIASGPHSVLFWSIGSHLLFFSIHSAGAIQG